MTEQRMIDLAAAEGFAAAAVTGTDNLVFDESFRAYCKENLCGKYGANYTCPPDCGTFEAMRGRILQRKRTLVLQTIWEIADYSDAKAVKEAKNAHNAALQRLLRRLRAEGVDGFPVGASGCSLCQPCAITRGEPCRFPEFCFSCMSAYCIFVKKLADTCGMEYDCGPGLLAFFGMYVFD